jgi:Transglycosylase SLT domain
MGDDTEFEDRWADVPAETPEDDETAQKKLELLKLASVPAPPIAKPGVELPPPPLNEPARALDLPPQTFMQKLMSSVAPRNLPGAPTIPLPPVSSPMNPPEVEPSASVDPPASEAEELSRLLSKDAPLPSEFQSGDVGPSRDVKISKGETKKFRGFTPDVDRAIVRAAKQYGVDPDLLRGFVAIESNGDPNSNRDKKTQYKGLMQIGRAEWSKFGQGDIYNADDNIAAGARLLRDNAERFKRTMGRDPSPREQYLMHQQGLGFYTKGTMTNIGGNLPASAKGDPNNWTREGFENFWGRKLESLMAQAKGAQVTGNVPPEGISAFFNPEPTATQKTELTGGLANTPIAAAQTAMLMHGTPIEQIKQIAEKVNKATVAGAIKNQSGINPTGVRPIRGQRPVEGQLPQAGSVTHTRPDMMPIPGMPQSISVNPAMMQSPSVLSTAAQYQDMQPKPIVPPAPAPSFMDKVKAALSSLTTPAGPDVRDQGLKALRETLAAPGESTMDFIKRVSKFDQEITPALVSGVEQVPTALVGGMVAPLAAGAGMLLDSPTLKQFGGQTAQDTEDTRHAILKMNNLDPETMTPNQKMIESVGQNLSPSGVKTGFNYAVQKVAETFLAPTADALGQKFPIPSLIPEAHAASVFGKPPVIVNTPGGPVVMNDASLSGMVYGGVLTMGFGLGLSQSTRAARWIRENPVPSWMPGSTEANSWMRGVTDPRRDVPGAPGTKAASIPEDLLKGGTVDRTQAMLDIADRQHRYDNGLKVGIDPIAADVVYQKYRIQTGSGADNLIHGAIQDGRLETDDFTFHVPNSMGKIKEFAQTNPGFMTYLKAWMIYDQLRDNHNTRANLPMGSARFQHYPTRYTDAAGQVWDLQGTRDLIRQAHIDFPEYRQVYRDYAANLAETRRFVSDGGNAVENMQALDDHTISRPSHPIFSTAQNSKKLLDRVLNDDNPLRIAEDNMRTALAKQMKYDAEAHYIGAAAHDAFTPRSSNWVSTRGSVAKEHGAVLRRRYDGQTYYYTADPLLVSLMNSGDVPMTGMGKFFSGAKSVFQSTTTGVYAPHFAPTGGIRAMEQGFTTYPRGVRTEGGWTVRAAGPLSTAFAIPAQIIPRVMGSMAPTLRWFEDRVSHTPLGQMIDPRYHNIISRTFEHAYNNSFYKRMKDAGAYNGATLEQARDTHNAIMQAKIDGSNPDVAPMMDYLARASRHWQRFIQPLNEGLRAVQEAPNFAWAYKAGKGGRPTIEKNGFRREMSDAELAMRMRDYTGDPSTKGFIWTKDLGGNPELLRYSGPGQNRAAAYKAVGQAAHAARIVTPWSGVLFQSPASTLAAMRDNPIRANMAFTVSHVMPAMVAYLWNMNQGQEYVDYMMNGRSDGNSLNNIYIAAPGKKPWEGHEIPHYQEGILARQMTLAFMQQYYGRNATTMGEDVTKALKGLAKGAIIPPQPSPLTMFLANKGIVMPEGFGGEAYARRANPYIDLGGGDSTTELTARAFAPSIADMVLAAHEGFSSAPAWKDVPDVIPPSVKAGFAQVGKRVAQRTSVLRDIIGYNPRVAGSTAIAEEMYEKQHVIDDLFKRYRMFDKKNGAISTKGASVGGMALASKFLPQLPPSVDNKMPNPGMPQTVRNPIYKAFMGEMEKSFSSDSPDKGGQGYKSMWSNYGIYTQAIKKMRTVNEGNSAEWVKRQEAQPRLMAFLEKNGVNPRDYRSVSDFYTARRNEVAQKILYTIKATEARFDKLPPIRAKLGPDKHFKIEDLDPNQE